MSIVWCYFLGPHRIALAAEEVWQHSVIREIASVPKQTVGKVSTYQEGVKGEIQHFQLAERVALS